MGREASLCLVGPRAEAQSWADTLAPLGFRIHACEASALMSHLAQGGIETVLHIHPSPLEPHAKAYGSVHLALSDDTPEGYDAVLRPDAHPLQVASRLRALMRLSVMETVAHMRSRDAQLSPAPVEVSSAKTSILFVGPPDPAYLRLSHALSTQNVDVIAAFSTFGAFDYLHERTFDGVVLNAAGDADMAHTVCSAMRRNTRLYHTPALILTPDQHYARADEAFARGASDILWAKAECEDFTRHILTLAQERQRRRAAKATLERCRHTGLLDHESDLYTPKFAFKHMSQLEALFGQRQLDLTLVALRAHGPADLTRHDRAHLQSALKQFASMLRHCVRSEDMAVRLNDQDFVLVLPATDEKGAQTVAKRVAAIAECTAYESADPYQPFRLEIAKSVSPIAPGEDPQHCVARIMASLPAVQPHKIAV